MIGHALAAGERNGLIRSNAAEIAEFYSVRPERLERALKSIESEDFPQILLLQNPDPGAKVGAVTFFSSVWSKSYTKIGAPFGEVQRDFHYQCMFSAIAALVEVDCDRIRIENPMSGYPWRRDAYICLMEAFRNVQKNIKQEVTVHLEQGSYDEQMVKKLNYNQPDFNMQEHRPVGICMNIFEGMNMRTVFVESAKVTLRDVLIQR